MCKPLVAIALASLPTFALAQDAPVRPDLMTFAQGVLPVSITSSPADTRSLSGHAIGLIDGNPRKLSMTPKPGGDDLTLTIVYALPAPTTFDRFAVPEIRETPSPSQTFFKTVEVAGSVESPDGPFVPLAQGALSEHGGRGEVTELTVVDAPPEVSWVRLTLSGGLELLREQTFFEFTEVIANGTQQPVENAEGFSGVWSGRGVNIELAQDGVTVTGCYDKKDKLTGTVDGRVLRALGADDAGVQTQFILIAAEDGSLKGLRSTNGAPFRDYNGAPSDKTPVCLTPEPPKLGCGAVVHGIGFDFDSDVLRPDSAPILQAMFEGLSAEGDARVSIVGHSSSEGAEDYNRDLSERRAASVVAALVKLGFDAGRISAAGMGEDDPIASNDDEAGRSLNRRVEVVCAG